MSVVFKSDPVSPYNLLRASLTLFKKTPNELADAELTQARRQANNELTLENRVLASKEASAVVITEQEVQRAYQQIRDRYEDEECFLHDLAKNQLDQFSLRAALYRQCKVDTVLDVVGSRVPEASDSEVGIYYHLHAEQFKKPELREASHIFISINPKFAENTREKAWSRIIDIRSRLYHKPNQFSDLALKHSECPTAVQGGKLGLVPRGTLYPELDTVLFTMRKGEISDALESEVGFHLLLCENILKAKTIPLETASAKIKELLKQRGKRANQKAWINSLGKQP